MKLVSLESANPKEEVPVYISDAPAGEVLSLTARIESTEPSQMASGALNLPAQSLKVSGGGSAFTTVVVPPEMELEAAGKRAYSELVIVVQGTTSREERTCRVEILNEKEEE